MFEVPRVHYARVDGGAHVGFLTLGDGTPLVGWPGGTFSAASMFDEPRAAYMYRRIAGFVTSLSIDRRGLGYSDPIQPSHLPTLDQQVADTLAVIDTVGADRVAVWGNTWDAQALMLLAARHPERVSKLLLTCTTACPRARPGHPYGVPEEVLAALDAELSSPGLDLGPKGMLELMAPSSPDSPGRASWFETGSRAAVSSARAYADVHMNADVREALPAITAPTLVLHSTRDQWVPVESARYLAAHIPDARLVEYDSADHILFTDHLEKKLAEIEDFLEGAHRPRAQRRLLTVLFTDVVGSTERVSATGDRHWTAMLDEIDDVVDRQVRRHDGRVAKVMGDGHLALFERPSDAVGAGQAITRILAAMGVEVRAGAHIGEVELRGDDVAGIAVHVGARVSAKATAGELLVTRTVADLLAGSPYRLSEHGEHELKGLPGSWPLYAVTG